MEELNSIDVAKAVMAEANKQEFRLNMTQLQKLLYIVYGTCLVMLNRRPFDEHVHAWPFGPVFPKTRNKLLDIINAWKVPEYPSNIPEDLQFIIQKVVKFYGSWPSKTLVEWTHTEGAPWDTTKKMPNFKWNDKIGDGLIKDYFESRVIKRRANA